MEQMYGENIPLKVISKLLTAKIDLYEIGWNVSAEQNDT
jgi:hypothetical protein